VILINAFLVNGIIIKVYFTMEVSEDSIYNPNRVHYHFLLRQLPDRELSAWMQVFGNKKELEALKAWISLRESIDEKR
tara:strand:+ start:230 stop:463 length:234 start_codon:yes stop_codon:yes gene_type:complete